MKINLQIVKIFFILWKKTETFSLFSTFDRRAKKKMLSELSGAAALMRMVRNLQPLGFSISILAARDGLNVEKLKSVARNRILFSVRYPSKFNLRNRSRFYLFIDGAREVGRSFPSKSNLKVEEEAKKFFPEFKLNFDENGEAAGDLVALVCCRFQLASHRSISSLSLASIWLFPWKSFMQTEW